MKIISLNINGIRAGVKKGFLAWLNLQQADIVCLQETRIPHEQLTSTIKNPPGYNSVFHCAERKGYSGVAVYYKRKPDRIHLKYGWEPMDREARFLQIDYGALSIISLYLPSGSSSPERQAFKYEVMEHFTHWLKEKQTDGREYIICGDLNIAHKEIDLKNWKANQEHSGFLPEEREWLTLVVDQLGYVDVFRQLNPNPGQYTWWSNRGQAWAKNVGWRIDYQMATPNIAALARTEAIYKEQRFSDHAPLIIEYNEAGT
ncbi:exodeoxyribonuclease III [Deltaproteobacteria bacterium TL4]